MRGVGTCPLPAGRARSEAARLGCPFSRAVWRVRKAQTVDCLVVDDRARFGCHARSSTIFER